MEKITQDRGVAKELFMKILGLGGDGWLASLCVGLLLEVSCAGEAELERAGALRDLAGEHLPSCAALLSTLNFMPGANNTLGQGSWLSLRTALLQQPQVT